MMSSVPTPGSRDAGSMGCTCPIIDNGHGHGYMGGLKDKDGNVVFVTQADCPLHGLPELMPDFIANNPDLIAQDIKE